MKKNHKNQHYMPRFYYRSFSCSENREKIWVKPLKLNNCLDVYENKIANFASETNYNQGSYSDDLSSKNELDIFTPFDRQVCKAFQTVSNINQIQCNSDLKNIVRAISLYSMNNPSIREDIADFISGFCVAECYQCGNIQEHIGVSTKHTTNFALIFAEKIYDIIGKWLYILIESDENCQFITSDNPVSFFREDEKIDHIIDYSAIYDKIIDKEIFFNDLQFNFNSNMVFLPISPKISILGFKTFDLYCKFVEDSLYLESMEKEKMFKFKLSRYGSIMYNTETISRQFKKTASHNKELLVEMNRICFDKDLLHIITLFSRKSWLKLLD